MNKMTVSEKRIREEFVQRGWEVVKPSWPDLLMYNEETKEIQFVEVKGQGDRISLKQRASFIWLQRLGFTVKIIFVPRWASGEVKEHSFNKGLDVKAIRRKGKVISHIKTEGNIYTPKRDPFRLTAG